MLGLFSWRTRADPQDATHLAPLVQALKSLNHADLAEEVALHARSEVDPLLRVTVFGRYSVGKSTLINALLGEQLLAAKLKPTTGVATELRYGPSRVVIRYRDGRSDIVSQDEAMNLMTLDVASRARDRVERVVISAGNTVLKPGLALIDTPGVLDENQQSDRARREVAAADLVLLVMRADSMLTGTERELALSLLTRDLGKPVVPIINWLSATNAAEHQDLRAILKSFSEHLIQPFDKPWFEVDALHALRYRLGIEGAVKPRDDYERLAHALKTLAGNKAARLKLKRKSRGRWRQSWIRRSIATNSAILTDLRQEAENLASERRRLAQTLEASLRRIAMNRDGDRARCLEGLDQFLAGRASALERHLPQLSALKTEDQRKQAVLKAARAFDRALAAADDHANAILMSLAADANVALDPISVRELALLEIPTDAAMAQPPDDAAVGAGLLIGGAVLLITGAWLLALPAALGAWLLGRASFDSSKEIAVFRSELIANIDTQLQNLRPLLESQFDARVDTLGAAIKNKLGGLANVPPVKEELKAREDLAAALQKLRD